MPDYEDFESGQQISQEEFKKRWKQKPPIKKAIEKVFKKKPVEEEFPEEFEAPEPRQTLPTKPGKLSQDQMGQAEEEISQKQYLEWKEQGRQTPESEIEVTSKLIELDAKMARKKEMMQAQDTEGVVHDVAIEMEEEYPEIFTPDLVKGNLEEIERACIFGHVGIVNAMKTIGQSKQFSFVRACRFNKAQLDAIVNISRAKRGFSAILVKTDKHVSEGVVQHVQKAFEEKKKTRWGIF